MKNIKTKITAGICVIIMALCASSCGTDINPEPIQKNEIVSSSSSVSDSNADTQQSKADSSKQSDKPKDSSSSQEESSSQADPNKPEPSYKVSLTCVGDNLIHDNIYLEAERNSGQKGKYNFDHAYKPIESYINGDINIINQETIVTDVVPARTYPCFATPKDNADKIKSLGFNVVSMCNNHVFDQGEAALQDSLSYWSKLGVLHYGAYADQADCDNIKTMEVNGIKFAFVGYMEHTNGIDLPDSAKAVVIRLKEEEKVKAQIQKADKMADVVVVSCHYGTEISNELNDQQKYITPKLVQWGADLIIGTQAHALSTCGYLDKPDGTKAFVYYGLGNFLNTMYDKNSLIGLMGKLDVVKDKNSGKISFENVKAIPLISHFEATVFNSDWTNCQIIPYAKYTDEMFAKNFVRNDGFNRNYVNYILNTYVPKEFLSIE